MPDMPNLTAAQIVGWLTTFVTALVVLFKLDLSDARQAALVTILAAVATLALKLSDAIIRHGRASIAAAAITAQALKPVVGDPPTAARSAPQDEPAQPRAPPATSDVAAAA